MPPQETQPDTRAADSMEQLVTNLFDAVRYSEQAKTLQAQTKTLEREREAQLARIDYVTRDTDTSLRRVVGDGTQPYLKALSSQVTEFVRAAVEQAKASAEREFSSRMADADTRAGSESTKALKSLESYFSATPIPVMDRVLNLRLGSTGYEADSNYTCRGGIAYKLALATKNSKFFGGEFRLSLLGKKVNIPVELAKTWIKKEPTPRFEKLERYVLQLAEVTDRQMILEFENEETKARMKLISSQTEGNGMATVEYVEGARVAKVSSDAGLNKHLDMTNLGSALGDLRNELLALEQNKAALVELTLAGEDVLRTLKCRELLNQVLKLMGPTYRVLVERMRSRPVQTRGGTLGLPLVRERLALLGPASNAATAALSLG